MPTNTSMQQNAGSAIEGERGDHQSLLGARAACPAATARPRVGRNGLRRRGSAGMRLKPTRATQVNKAYMFLVASS